MNNLRVEVYEDNPDKTLENKWWELWGQTDDSHFFNSPGWYRFTQKALSTNDRTLYVAWSGSDLVGVLPLEMSKKLGIKSLMNPGKKYLDKSSILISESNRKDVFYELLTSAAASRPVYLAEIDENLFKLLNNNTSKILIRESSVNLYLPILDNPYRFLSNKQKNKIVNKIQRLSGKIIYKSYKTNLRHLLEKIIDVDLQSSKFIKGIDTFSESEERSFYELLIKYFPGSVTFDFIYYEGKPIVYSIGLEYKGIYHAFNTSFIPEYKSMIPGKILTYFILERLKNNKYRLMDFGRGDSVLKRDFTQLVKQQYDVYFATGYLMKEWWNNASSTLNFVKENSVLYDFYRRIIRKNYNHLVKI